MAASREMNKHGIDYEQAPEIWDAIVKCVITLKDQFIANDNFKKIVVGMAQGGYKNEERWKEVKEIILINNKLLDAASIIEIRNIFVEYFPNDRAFISFLEQKSIQTFFMFGRSHKSVLTAGASSSKFKKYVPYKLEK